MTCPRCQRNRHPNWFFWAALVLAAVSVGNVVRVNKEYRVVHQNRQSGDSLLADWYAKKCIPR